MKGVRLFIKKKDLSFCHKLRISNPYIFAIHCCRPYIFQTINSVRSNNLSFKYQWFTPPGCNDIVIRKFEFENSIPL